MDEIKIGAVPLALAIFSIRLTNPFNSLKNCVPWINQIRAGFQTGESNEYH